MSHIRQVSIIYTIWFYSGTISQQDDLKAMTTNGQSSSEIVDIPLNQIPSDPEKVLENYDPGISKIYLIKN